MAISFPYLNNRYGKKDFNYDKDASPSPAAVVTKISYIYLSKRMNVTSTKTLKKI